MTARAWAARPIGVAINPMVPGDKPDEKNFRDLESMPVRAIITSPANGTKLAAGTRELEAARRRLGRRLCGEGRSTSRSTSAPPGSAPSSRSRATNMTGSAGPPRVKLPSDGYYEIWARATDSRGVMQPHVAGNWNPQGYGGNPMHRVAVLVADGTADRAGHAGARSLGLERRRLPSRRLHAERGDARAVPRRRPAATRRSMPAPPATTSSWWRRRA